MEKQTNAVTEQTAEEKKLAEEQFYLTEAPIAELAKHAGVDIDKAVNMRVAAALENTPPRMDISVRTIDPIGQLHGYASVKIGGMTVDDFKIFERKEDGELFVGMPSKKGKGGFHDTVRIDKDFREDFNNAVIDAYHKEGEKLMARAAAIANKPRIADQMAKAEKQAAEHNASRPAPAKAGKEQVAEI